jgi:hypothetical protein
LGMGIAYLFYELLASYGISGNQTEVYYLHFLLIAVEIIVILLIFKSFKRA